MTSSEKFEMLKQEADKAPKKYSESLKFLKNHTFKFNDEFWFISTNYNDEKNIKGTFKIIPKSFRVMISVGEPTLYLVAKVIFESIEFDNPEDNELLKYFLENVPPRGLYRVSNVFKQAPDKEFVKLRRLIAMDDLKLLIDEVNVEMLK